ncbi:hypothetical protein EDB81DRAFT_910111 [Dactylonectria macrodidyma]|uniref:Uncharacterized protein n=1 Tax=Dactylonectria macrodidyma TaxID=307937 RepID=A0A9P9FRP5_9HYPO|nr:hypothetical protein EDB81DRAFT_910111 [Dactylonectria macrodidyma]
MPIDQICIPRSKCWGPKPVVPEKSTPNNNDNNTEAWVKTTKGWKKMKKWQALEYWQEVFSARNKTKNGTTEGVSRPSKHQATNLTRQWDTAANNDSRPVIVKENRVNKTKDARDSPVDGLMRFINRCTFDRESRKKPILEQNTRLLGNAEGDKMEEANYGFLEAQSTEEVDGVKRLLGINLTPSAQLGMVRRDNLGLDLVGNTHHARSIDHHVKPLLSPGCQIFLGVFLTCSLIIILYMGLVTMLHCMYPEAMRNRRPWTMRKRKTAAPPKVEGLDIKVDVVRPAAARGRADSGEDEGLKGLPAVVPRSMV